MIDIQKERAVFEKLWTDSNGHFRFFDFDQDACKYRLNEVTDNLSKEELLSASITLNTAWMFWLGAKKLAIPKDFVLVPRNPTEGMLGAAWEAPPAGGPSVNRRVFYEKQTVVYKAMVYEAEKEMTEAQEQNHDY